MRLHISPLRITHRLNSYLFQGFLAMASLAVFFVVEDAFAKASIVAAMGATSFTVFVIPHSPTAQPRRVIGGHTVGIAVGVLFWYLLTGTPLAPLAEANRYIFDVMAAGAVGLAVLAMAGSGTEHPPAAGTALGLVVHSWGYQTILFVVGGAVLLSAIRTLLAGRLEDLL